MNSATPGSYLFQSTFSGCALTAHLPKAIVSNWIPAGSALVAAQEPLHPVVFLLGDHERGAVVYGDNVVTAPISYNEWAALVPGVSLPGQPGGFTFVVTMVCNYLIAQVIGNTYYGYRKQMGSLSWRDNTCEISVGKPIMSVSLEQATACENADAAMLYDCMQAPVLGVGASGNLMHSRWNFDPATAEVWRVGASLEVDRGFAPGVSPFTAPVSRDEGFMLRGVPWQLTAPMRN